MINLTDNAKEHLDNYLQQVRTCLTLVDEAGLAEKNIGAEHAGDQRTDN